MTTEQHIVGFIFARGGSKGVPGKNLRKLGGRPLIAHAIEAALQTQHLSRVIVSTDCERIADTALLYGAEVPFLRPPELATDTSPERLAWRHAVTGLETLNHRRVDVMVSIPPTCPLRQPEDIDLAIDTLLSGDGDIVLTAAPSRCNPYFNMITIDAAGKAQLASTPRGTVTRRQDAPRVYELTAVAYAARRDSVFEHDSIFESDVRAVEVPEERAVDIDTEFDLTIAELLLARREQTEGARAA